MSYKDTLTYAVAMHDFDEMCKSDFKKMMKKLEADPLIKKIIKECEEKEVKKVRPYFEVKVVKVEKKNNNLCSSFCSWNGFCIHQKKRIGKKECIISEDKGNWVNGENLDKIKFPVPCSYVESAVKRIGMLNKVFFRGDYWYLITDCSQQYIDSNGEQFYANLKNLIKNYDVHILKGKIIIYEEE